MKPIKEMKKKLQQGLEPVAKPPVKDIIIDDIGIGSTKSKNQSAKKSSKSSKNASNINSQKELDKAKKVKENLDISFGLDSNYGTLI